MIVTGRTYKDDNFVYLCTEDTLYTIARATGDWSSITVDPQNRKGYLTREMFESYKANCNSEGTYELDEE